MRYYLLANEGALAEQLSATESQLRQALDEQQQLEPLAEHVEADKAALSAQLQFLADSQELRYSKGARH